VVDPGVRRIYTGKNPHTDHVHITFLRNPPAYKPYLSHRELNPVWFNASWLQDKEPGRNHPSHPTSVQYAQVALNIALKLQLEPDGWHGNETHAAMQAYQRKLGHKPGDKILWAEWSELGKETGVFSFTPPRPPPPPPVPSPPPPRRPISLAEVTPHRTAVGYIQRALNATVGSDVHGGYFDHETALALRKWQKSKGYEETGLLTEDQLQELGRVTASFVIKK
jgi:Putative peptidoglycan binding domain